MDISTMDFEAATMGKRSLALDAKNSKGQELCRRNSGGPGSRSDGRWPIYGGFTMIYLQDGAPSYKWVYKPTIVISAINHSYWSYKPT